MIYGCNVLTLAEEDFVARQYNVTFLPNDTQATVNISLRIDDVDEETEYFMLHLYVMSASYGFGIQPGDVTKATALIFRPGMKSTSNSIINYITVIEYCTCTYVHMYICKLFIKIHCFLENRYLVIVHKKLKCFRNVLIYMVRFG